MTPDSRSSERLSPLLTDLYQLTMAYGYWKSGLSRREAVFHLSFRKHPFGGGYTLACGLEPAIDFVNGFRFDEGDLSYLETLEGGDGKPLFEKAFLDFLGALRLSCDIDAVPEGTVVFPHEPLVRVRGPLIECQLLETALLNIINFQSLIATKAARVCRAARGDAVLEFGLRRAQGVDGALAASRAAYVGGCAATSNVLAGKLHGIPVRGTHAHSWVLAFDSEAEAFEAYARAMPNNCVFLVDTFDTMAGVAEAVRVGKMLRARGHRLMGIRLDSGDLAALSIEARRLLDAAGFTDAAIIASNDLDEERIEELKQRGAAIGVWGVGTRLATAYDEPALGGVYKLSAIREPDREWQYRLKLSDDETKASIPGMVQVRRFSVDGQFAADVIYNELEPPEGAWRMHPLTAGNDPPTTMPAGDGEDLLTPVFRQGISVYAPPTLSQARDHAAAQLSSLGDKVKARSGPAAYPVGLEDGLHGLRSRLSSRARRPESDTS